jgi:hypothetical protein
MNVTSAPSDAQNLRGVVLSISTITKYRADLGLYDGPFDAKSFIFDGHASRIMPG